MVTTRSRSLSTFKPVKIPTDSYDWIKYCQRQVRSPEGSWNYFKCEYNACNAKKMELCDQYNSVIEVVYKGQHKHDPPKKVTLRGCKVLTTAKSLKEKSITEGHPIEVVHNDDSATLIAPTSLNKSPGVPVTPAANSDVAETDQKVTTRSKSLSASKPFKIPTDDYAWIRYGKMQVKNPEGFRTYFNCKYNACHAKKTELRDQFNSVIEVVYKGQHNHDPPNIGDSTTVIAQNSLNKSPGVRAPYSLRRSPAMPVTPTTNADSAKADQKVTTCSKSLSASKPVKTPTDSYAWIKYGQRQMKSPEGFRGYFKCKYSACQAKKLEFRDIYNSIIDVVYKGQHKHDPPKRVISKRDKVLSSAKSLKGRSISTDGLKEHPIEVGHIDGSEIKKRLKRNSSESSVDRHPKKPKFVVHAAANTKISADSYNWRKYQQKMVTGNPHPRNCYKCAVAGCTVKKRMEKVVDGSQVIITYKGLHNHDIPTVSPQSKKREYSSTTEAAKSNKSARTL
ncbi:hypothetical protein M8C21_008495 [Ambrosia artemisiifolia]|uniref:WRKY domain-containing protein n=1 Tax=Ambrosia artemisiifolia TaxID=4212 RepID=A0AAD5BXE7_AMBAR|nr:hypothetical protein M8C21_008495 [Ambrosia artemisiifolia]